ncbi:hypothetical protein CWE15_06865 [Aliidiomarina taiwanensis]|uniref:Outer membrane protein beta-barrel domain-containing protein n=1 Tax=Aliidiomarina taiwanensis TaxID=946228 RepID=A0A432X1V1_9GAMM|nr:hypothetical protein [Aliidiomarina taiwanensis]RUO40474.1 hypothetical protein CWE15_06865 [Aliidiomarina taiwanensis]
MQVKTYARRSLGALAASLLATFSITSQAITLTQPSYTHVSAAYTNSNNNTRGLFIDVEYELQHKFYVTGTFQNSKYTTQGHTSRESIIDLGLGKYFTIADGLTLDASASLGRYTPSSSLFDSGNNFYTLNTGFRNRFEAFETRLGYRHIKFSGQQADQGIVASAWYYPTPQMSIGITFNDVYSKSTWGFGARILF